MPQKIPTSFAIYSNQFKEENNDEEEILTLARMR